ncbi:MAG TPA: hypothetical protein VJA86_03940 [Candidatus Nanoarchaeia archaeon]|nr:hypothetical protein [Candidatus Nanoarchaeia archaeon]
MELQRYLLRDENKGEFFGAYTADYSGADAYFLFAGGNIGITKTTEEELKQVEKHFIDDFLTTDDKLILRPDETSPEIARESLPGRYLTSSRIILSNKIEILQLIKLIQSPRVHAFMSSRFSDGGYLNILTFSRQAPPERLYLKGRSMPVSVEAEGAL